MDATGSPNGIAIRKARFTDAASIHALGERSFTSYGMEDWTFSLVAELLEEFPRYCLVATKGKKLVGFLLGKPYQRSRTRFYIYWMAVQASMRGHGVGRRLIGEILAIARDARFKTAIIDTGKENHAMQRIVGEAGFSPIVEEMYFKKELEQ